MSKDSSGDNFCVLIPVRPAFHCKLQHFCKAVIFNFKPLQAFRYNRGQVFCISLFIKK